MNYRSSLEVAKYLPAGSALQLALISQAWNRVAVCDELWSTLLESAGLAEYRRSGSFKNSYRLQTQNQQVLAFIKQGRVLRYDCGRRKWQPAVALSEYPVQIDDASLTQLPEGSLIVLGIITRDSSKAVYSVSAQGSIERLRDTLHIRVKTGALCFRGVVYCFGSLSYGEGRTCEKLMLRSGIALDGNQWQPLPDMLDSRFRFVPVEFAGSVYLNGGWCNTCEVFEIRSESFSRLSLRLESHYDCFSAVSVDHMEVFTLKGIAVYKWLDQNCKMVHRRPLASEGTRVLGCLRVKQRLYTVLDWNVFEYLLNRSYKAIPIKNQTKLD